MATDKVIFLKEWYDEIMKGDDFVETTPQEMAYMLYSAAVYSFTGEKTNIGEVFGKEYSGLNRTMSGYYGQIDRITQFGKTQAGKNQKYDNEAIKALAEKGYSQVQICQELGYDVSKSKSLSSNPGYKEGRKLWLAVKEQGKTGDSSSKNCQKIAKTSNSPFNF